MSTGRFRPRFFEAIRDEIERVEKLVEWRSKNWFVNESESDNFAKNFFQRKSTLAERTSPTVQLVENDGKTGQINSVTNTEN